MELQQYLFKLFEQKCNDCNPQSYCLTMQTYEEMYFIAE